MKKLTGLQHFRAVCSTRNLTAAAQQMGISQPALTQAIGKLERQLDAHLFDRSTRPLGITPYGQMLLEYVSELERSTDDLTARIEAVKSGTGGMLRIGSGPDWIHEVLPVAISRLQQDNPQIRVSLNVALNDSLRAQLDAGEIDLFFASVSDVFFGAAYKTRILLREKMHVVARSDHPIHQRGAMTLEELADEPWVMTGDYTFGRQLVRRVFSQAGVELPLPTVETNSVRAMINILRHSLKIGFLSEAHARAYPEIAQVQTVTEMPFREGGAVWRSDMALIPVAERFLGLAEQVIRDRAREGTIARSGC